jgi:hypothetical protein
VHGAVEAAADARQHNCTQQGFEKDHREVDAEPGVDDRLRVGAMRIMNIVDI